MVQMMLKVRVAEGASGYEEGGRRSTPVGRCDVWLMALDAPEWPVSLDAAFVRGNIREPRVVGLQCDRPALTSSNADLARA